MIKVNKMKDDSSEEKKVASPEESEYEKTKQDSQSNEQEAIILQLQNELKARTEEIEHYKDDLKTEKQKAQDFFDRYLRIQAEFENFRKRMDREKAEFLKYAMENFFRNLLPIIDNFELALDSAEKTSDLKGFSEGVKLIHKQFQDVLQREGLTILSSVGQIFDPTRHEAIMEIHSDEHDENTVVEEIKKGYYLKDRLLRPALVAVARKKPNDERPN